MNKWVLRLLSLAASVILGFVLGYWVMSLTVAAQSPIGLDLAKSNDPFAQFFSETVRLGEAETALRQCANQPSSSRQAILGIESDLIGQLRTDAKSYRLAPQLDIAEAIMLLRSSSAFPGAATNGDDRRARTVNDLLKKSGWSEDSPLALQEALKKIDGACKQ